MKRLIAKRRLKHGCDQCKEPILKGQIYYRKRTVFAEDNKVYGHTFTYCPRCKYRNEQRKIRFGKFKAKCHHPDKFIDEVWCYIPGEAVKQPDYCQCILCGRVL